MKKVMKKLKSILISRTLNSVNRGFLFSILIIIALPAASFGLLEIDINSPSERRYKVAIPDFKNLSTGNEFPELSGQLTKVISDDLDISGSVGEHVIARPGVPAIHLG